MTKSSLIAIVALLAMPSIAQADSHTREGAYALKATPKTVEPIYVGDLGYLDQAVNPWHTVTQGKWSREILDIDPTMNKAHWNLDAQADYDGDGKADTAKIYTNGKQTAVIVTFADKAKPPMVIYKNDGSDTGLEIYGNGRRFLLTVPEVGYKVLFMYKDKPVAMSDGD